MKPEIYLRVVLEVEENSVSSPPRLPLSDDNGGHDLLPQLGLTLLDGTRARAMGPWSENLFTKRAAKPFIKDSRHDHVTSGGSGKPVQPGSTSNDRNDVDVLGTRVVSAVHDGADREGQSHTELVAGRATTTATTHF